MFFCDLAVARRLEALEAFACRDTAHTLERLRPNLSAAEESIAGGWAVFTGVGSPISEARGLGLSGPVTADDMKRLESFYHSRGDAIRIEVSPMADPSLHELLGKRGYRVCEFSNLLVRPMTGGEKFALAAPGVTTRQAAPSEGKLWAQTVGRSFAEYFPITEEFLDMMSCWVHSTMGACYLATVDGEVAGGGAVVLHDDLALLGGAATLPQFRRRGVQTALLLARLARAAANGSEMVMTITLPGSGSQRNCERLGFRVVYTRAKFTHD
jgi:GNAT superfamily N-acetyltransferase